MKAQTPINTVGCLWLLCLTLWLIVVTVRMEAIGNLALTLAQAFHELTQAFVNGVKGMNP